MSLGGHRPILEPRGRQCSTRPTIFHTRARAGVHGVEGELGLPGGRSAAADRLLFDVSLRPAQDEGIFSAKFCLDGWEHRHVGRSAIPREVTQLCDRWPASGSR